MSGLTPEMLLRLMEESNRIIAEKDAAIGAHAAEISRLRNAVERMTERAEVAETGGDIAEVAMYGRRVLEDDS